MNELGAFLRTRRARLTPTEAGLISYGARRVPGLRREELAQLAGVSHTYYMRLEQGQSHNASTSVIDALARALRLSADERSHLYDLARPARSAVGPAETARPTLVRLLDGMPGLPAVLVDRRTTVLAWNPLGRALLAFHETTPGVNLARQLFLDPHTRDLYRDWHTEACRAVASLRLVAGRTPGDRALAELIGDLCINSTEFAEIWAHHPIAECVTGRKLLHHPVVGDLDLDFEVLQSADGSGQRLITYMAAPGTPAATALRLLAA
ncbi:helix-turn-helix domain-containing protein [Paractinoplanes atraurantiacus]|uniref:Helix-turn-helix domain-containing protein n=1 Tax=Paractinoplanes atraurantiacus TaxID=1036182 RepID=A0A285IML2_9ACTN|nr:helix-turn-helix transcriptional regulator [Actinoplanes atraurantiacus]SNY49212.1 Helix-turn-helix domain-containing protein [Actinoplanes atraurantiacus]